MLIDRTEGRSLFGEDPELYHRARAEYPGRVYELLAQHLGVGLSTRAFEIGPGTGIATRGLLRAVQRYYHLNNFVISSTLQAII